MEERLRILRKQIQALFEKARDKNALENLRIKYLGRNGEINKLFKDIAQLSVEQKRTYGNKINQLKQDINQTLNARLQKFQPKDKEKLDLLLPGKKPYLGHIHPLSKIFDELIMFFTNFGFSIATGPEIEYDWYNFEALNMPRDHPARDMFSSFYIKDDLLLRSHTSPVQIRVMENQHESNGKEKKSFPYMTYELSWKRDGLLYSHSMCLNNGNTFGNRSNSQLSNGKFKLKVLFFGIVTSNGSDQTLSSP